jgi:hypothetical protein
LKLAVGKRAGDVTFADHGRSGKQNFGEACEQFIARMRVSESNRYLHFGTGRFRVVLPRAAQAS